VSGTGLLATGSDLHGANRGIALSGKPTLMDNRPFPQVYEIYLNV